MRNHEDKEPNHTKEDDSTRQEEEDAGAPTPRIMSAARRRELEQRMGHRPGDYGPVAFAPPPGCLSRTGGAHIFVRTPKGTFCIQVDLSMTGAELEDLLSRHPRLDRIPSHLTRFLIHTSDHQDAPPLDQQGIRSGTTLTRMMRLPGGTSQITNGPTSDGVEDDAMSDTED